jgi:hypothetical protein
MTSAASRPVGSPTVSWSVPVESSSCIGVSFRTRCAGGRRVGGPPGCRVAVRPRGWVSGVDGRGSGWSGVVGPAGVAGFGRDLPGWVGEVGQLRSFGQPDHTACSSAAATGAWANAQAGSVATRTGVSGSCSGSNSTSPPTVGCSSTCSVASRTARYRPRVCWCSGPPPPMWTPARGRRPVPPGVAGVWWAGSAGEDGDFLAV